VWTVWQCSRRKWRRHYLCNRAAQTASFPRLKARKFLHIKKGAVTIKWLAKCHGWQVSFVLRLIEPQCKKKRKVGVVKFQYFLYYDNYIVDSLLGPSHRGFLLNWLQYATWIMQWRTGGDSLMLIWSQQAQRYNGILHASLELMLIYCTNTYNMKHTHTHTHTHTHIYIYIYIYIYSVGTSKINFEKNNLPLEAFRLHAVITKKEWWLAVFWKHLMMNCHVYSTL
jgi:hypothetical protein